MQRALVDLSARWSPDMLAGLLGQAMEVAAWLGREQVFAEADGAEGDGAEDRSVGFAFEAIRQPFAEQIDFLRQKRPLPTNVWTDALQGVHDRAIVVAGVTDTAMLEEFQAALIDAAANGGYVKDFARDFDRLVEKYGWEYRGERNWRIRTIFETNMRTSFMAGRLKQMRNPDVVKLRPYWQYVHGDRRTPQVPRKAHLSWNGLVLMWDDPWWQTHFPPNDWLCSCGVRTLSRHSLARLGKTGPDEAPRDALLPVIDPSTGQMVMQRQGIGFGWDYMPGDLWEQGLVPSALIDEAGALQSSGRHAVRIDEPEPIADLMARARPFQAERLAADLSPEAYLGAFLTPFGAEPGRAVLFEDKAGHRLPVSEALFRERGGDLKIGKRDRAQLVPWFAETLLDPDEIWLGVAAKRSAADPAVEELVLDRRYVRVDGNTGLIVVFEIGRKWWEGVTAYAPSDRKGNPSLRLLDLRRGGKLLWKRK